MRILGLAFLFMAITQVAYAQNFSCSIGKRAACLDYGDKICSTYAKCVDESASCFNNYQCDYEGFTCKSNVTECFAKNDELVQKYNNLLGKQRTLVSEYNDLLEGNRKVIRKHNDLLDVANDIEGQLSDLKDCLVYADDLDAAKLCGLY